MNPIRVIALLLVLAGVLALVYGGFTFVKATHSAKLGPIELSVDETSPVNIPTWAGVGAIVLGGVVLVAPILRKKRR